MRKFLAVVKHEYRKVVLKWSFVIGTILMPVIFILISLVPLIILSLRGGPTRIAVADTSGKILPRLEKNLSAERMAEIAKKASEKQFKNLSASQQEKMKTSAAQFMQDFVIVPIDTAGKNESVLRSEMFDRINRDEIDAYLIIPSDLDNADARFEFRSRKGSDFVSNETLSNALNEAVRSQRLVNANIDEAKLESLSSDINIDSKGIDETGAEKDSTGTFAAAFAIGLMIYVTLAIYGQAIMGAVVEEKETRIAEILFSSARPFELMMGKLVGVGLAGLTQFSIWLGTALLVITVAAIQSDLGAVFASLPAISPIMIAMFLGFFLVGFFLYASIFALIGSMVTTVQEGGQFSFPPILIMLAGFYFSFAVIRDPNSDVSFWVTIAPFLAPITMPVRILAEMPPYWQIALSFLLNIAAIAATAWLASRVYRVGMLMYGKRATIPEMLKWVRQA
jgi:ABC-2 type transport system permease protein